MLPVTIGLGVINFDLLINSSLGTLVSEEAPRAIDAAFRDLHAAPGDVLASRWPPCCSRPSAASPPGGTSTACARPWPTGSRQIFLLLVPAGVFCAVLATPIIAPGLRARRVRPADRPSSCPRRCSGSPSRCRSPASNLLLTRSFFSLQRPWIPTGLAAVNLVVNVVISLLLYRPFGIVGARHRHRRRQRRHDPAGRSTGCAACCTGAWRARRPGAALLRIGAASALLGAVSYGTWWVVDDVLGRVAARPGALRRRRRRRRFRGLHGRGAGAARPRGAADQRLRRTRVRRRRATG